ncbi:MAG: phosphoglycerate mutase family protein [Patescibacteria group bacterium]|nr:phosphoglycerate mutase family protein [Patescibacteria group bacterium]
MNNTFYFLRHGKTKIDKNAPVSRWVLSEVGEKQASQLTREGVFDDIDLIFSSTEDKAYKTVLPIAEKLGKKVIKLEAICEINRDNSGFLEMEEYEKTIGQCLKNPDKSFNSWETANHALERFSKQISELDKEYSNKKILVVGHGFTINMYFAKLLGVLDKVYERLSRNDFADWGIVKNQAVVKDIAKQA